MSIGTTPNIAAKSLAAMFAVQTTASLAMFGVAVIAPAAAPDIGVAPELIGTFTAIAYGVGMFAGLPTGPLCERFGAIRLSQIVLFLAFAGVAVLTFSSPAAALISAVLLGFCYGPVNPVSTQVLAQVAPARSRPLYFSVKQAGMPVGGAVGGAVLPVLVAYFDWRIAILCTGIVALGIAAAIQPLRGTFDSDLQKDTPLRLGSVAAPLRLIWQSPPLRRLTLVGFVFSGCQVSVATFYVVYLTSAMSMTLLQAGLVYTYMQTAAIFARLFWGALADRIIPARVVLFMLGIGTALFCVSATMQTSDMNFWLFGALSAALGVTSHGWNGVVISELVKFTPDGRTADAASGLQFLNLGGVAIVPPIFGLIVTTSGYTAAFWSTGAATCLAAFVALTLRPPR